MLHVWRHVRHLAQPPQRKMRLTMVNPKKPSPGNAPAPKQAKAPASKAKPARIGVSDEPVVVLGTVKARGGRHYQVLAPVAPARTVQWRVT